MKPLNLSGLVFVVVSYFAVQQAQANPLGGVVAAGSASISQSGNTMIINQTSSRAIIDWNSFNISPGQSTSFHFLGSAGAGSSVLNEVGSGAGSSFINGVLNSYVGAGNRIGGQVYIYNPSGILIGPQGVVNVGGFVGTTLSLGDSEFMKGSGNLTLGSATVANQGVIQNEGQISALDGDILMIAHNVENDGTLTARNVGLAAGSYVEIKQSGPSGSEHISVLAGDPSNPGGTGVNNSSTGLIKAVTTELQAAGGNVYALAVNNGGAIHADTLVSQGGHIYLMGNGGAVENSGTLDASDTAAGGKGGSVTVTGSQVTLTGTSTINADGDTGGGTVLIGGGSHGQNPAVPNATDTTVEAGATISANAITKGNGGQVVVWSDDTTTFAGQISARGGVNGGNGGDAEVSGNVLNITGHADLTAPNGKFGTMLLDPGSVDIISGSNPGSEYDGLGDGDITDGWLNNQLTTASVAISTSDAGADTANAPVLTVDTGAAVSWSTGSTLTLTGGDSVVVNGTITGTGLSGLSLISPNGNIVINSTLPVTAGTGGISMTASSGINIESAVSANGITTLNADSGNAGTGTLSLGASVSSGNSTLTIDAGSITFNAGGALNSGTASTTISATDGNSIGLGSDTGTLALNNTALGNITASGGLILNTTGNVSVGAVSSGIVPEALTINASGSITFDTGPSSFGSLNVASGSGVVLGASITTTGDQSYTPQVTLGGPVTLTSTTLELAGGAVGGGYDLTLANTGTASGTGVNGIGTLNLNGSGNVGSSTTAFGTSAGTISFGNSGTATTWINNSGSSVDLVGTSVGNVTLTCQATTIDPTGFSVGNNTLTLINSGTVSSIAGALTAGTLALDGSGNIGASGANNALSIDVPTISFGNSGGSAWIKQAPGQSVDLVGTAGGNVTLTAGTITIDSTGFSVGNNQLTLINSGTVTANGNGLLTAGTLTLDGSQNVGSSANAPFVVNAGDIVVGNTGGSIWINDNSTSSVGLSGTVAGLLSLSAVDGINVNAALTMSSAGPLTLNADSGNTGLGVLTISAPLTAAANNTPISITAGDMTINGAGSINNGSGLISITASDGGGIGLGSGAGQLTLTGPELGAITTSGGLTLTTTGSGNVAIGGIGAVNSGNITGPLTIDAAAGGTVTFNGSASTFTSLNVASGSGVTLAASVSTSGDQSYTPAVTLGNNVILNSSTLELNSVSGGGFNLTLDNTGVAQFNGNVNNVGTLTANNLGGTLQINNGSSVTTTTDQNYREPLSLGTGAVTLTSGTIELGVVNGNNGLALDNSGQVSANGTVTVGTLTLEGSGNVGSSATPLTVDTPTLVLNNTGSSWLNNGANALGVSGTTGSLSLLAGSTTFAATTVDGNLAVTASGTVGQSGALTVDGTTSLNSGANSITLNNVNNDFQSAVTLSTTAGGNVNLNNGNNSLAVNGSVGGNLTASGAGINDGGSLLTVTGTTSLTAGTANAINLSGPSGNGDSLNGAVTINSGGNVTLVDAAALKVNGTVTGSLTASGAGIGDGGAPLSVGGATSLTAGSGNPISFADASDSFGGAVTINSAENVTLNDAAALAVNGTISGNLNATGLGINQGSSPLTVDGTTLLNAGAGAITLNNAGNDLVGTVTLNNTGANDASLNNGNNALSLIGSVGGNLTATTTGATTIAGSLSAGSTATFNTGALVLNNNVSAATVNLNNTGAVSGTGTVSATTALELSGSGDVGASGSAINTDAAGVVLNSESGNSWLNNGANAVSLSGTSANGSVVLTAGATTISGAVSTGSGNLTLNTTALNLANGVSGNLVTLDNSGLVSGAGTVDATTLTLSGAGNVGASGSSINTDAGTLALNGESGGSWINNGANALNLSGSSASGSVNVTAGATTISGAVNTGNGNLTLNTTTLNLANGISGSTVTLENSGLVSGIGTIIANNLTLDGSGNVGAIGSAINTDAGQYVLANGGSAWLNNGANAVLVSGTTGGGLSMSAGATTFGTTTVDGALNVTASGAVGQTGAVTVDGATSLNSGVNSITLNNSGNDFGQAVTVNTGVGGNVTLNNGNNALVVNGTVGGNLVATGAGINDGGSLLTVTGTTTLTAGTGAGDNITLTGASGDSLTGPVAINSANNVDIDNTQALTVNGTVSGNLQATGAGISDGGVLLTVTGTSALTATGGQNINLVGASGDSLNGAVTVSGNNVTLDDTAALALSGQVNGNLVATGAGISQGPSALAVMGTSSLNAGANSITLNNGGNDFTGAVTVHSGGNVNLTDTGALAINGSITGNLTASGAGISDGQAVLTVGGTSSLTAGAGNPISFATAGDSFTKAVTINSGDNVTLNDASALTVNGTVSGNLSATGAGITDGGSTLSVTGTTTLAAGTDNINLSGATGDSLQGAVSITTGNNVIIVDTANLSLSGTVSGSLFATGAGIGDGGNTLTVAGTTSLTAGTANPINFSDTSDGFTGAVTINSGGNVTLVDTVALKINGTVTGSLTATGAGIGDGGAPLSVGGATSLTAGAGNPISFADASDSFTGAVTINSAENVTLNDTTALAVNGTISGNLNATGLGINQGSSPLTVDGTTSLNAGAGAITLNNAGNDFVGTVALNNTGANDASLNNGNNALSLVGSVGGNLTAATTGATTIAGSLSAGSTATFNTGALVLNNNVSAAAVNLNNTGAVSGTGTVSATAALELSGSGDVGASGSAINTDAAGVVLNSESGNSWLNNGANAVSLSGTSANGSVVLTAGATTIGGEVSTGSGNLTLNTTTLNLANDVSGNSVTLNNSGLVSGAGTVDATILTLSGAGNVGASGSSINTDAGTLALNGESGGSWINNGANALNLSGSSANGSVNVTAGATTISGAVNTGNGNLTLNTTTLNPANGITGSTVALDNSGLVSGAGTITANNLTLDGSGNVGANGSAINTDAGQYVLANGGSAWLNNGANVVQVSGTTGGSLLLSAGATTFGTTTVDGALNVTASGAVSQSGALTVDGATSFNSGANSITLNNSGNDFGQAVTVNTGVGGNVTLNNGNNDLVVNGTVGGNLVATGAGISDGGSLLTVTGTTALTAGTGAGDNITLIGASGDSLTGPVTINSANNVNIDDTQALTVNGTVSGNLQATGAGITDGGALLTVTGTSTLTATGGQNINLVGASGDSLDGAVTVSGNNVTLDDTAALALSGQVNGNLVATGAGISQGPSALTATGTSSLNAGANSITLNNAGNDFTGTVTLNNTGANNATLNNGANSLSLDGSVGGSLTTTTTGSTTIAGTLTAGATMTLNTAGLNLNNNVAATTVNLNNTGAASGVGLIDATTLNLSGSGNVGSSGGPISTDAGNVVLNNESGSAWLNNGANAVNLSGTSANGSLNLTAGATTINGAVDTGTGSLSLNTTALSLANGITAASVTLNNSGLVSGAGVIDAGTLTLAGAGDVGASGSAINTDVGNLALDNESGNTWVNNGANGVSLSGASANGSLNLTGGTVLINGPLNLGTSALTLNNSGTVSDVTAASTITAGTLTLDGTADVGSSASALATDVGGVVFNNALGNSWLNNGANAVNLSGTSGTGNINVTAGATSISGPLNASGGNVTLTTTTLGLNNNITASGITLANSGLVSGGGSLDATTLALTGSGNIGASGSPVSTDVSTVVLNGETGNSWLNNGANAANLSGTSANGSINLTAGATTISGALNTGSGSVTLNTTTLNLANNVSGATVILDNSGAVTGSGVVTATTLNLDGSGTVASSSNPLATDVSTIGFGNSGGASAWISQNPGTAVDLVGTASGNVALTSGAMTIDASGFNGASLTLDNSGTADVVGPLGLTGTLTVSGAGNLTVANTISAGTVSDSENTTFDSTAALGNGSTVTTTGDQDYTGTVSLQQNTTLDSSTLELQAVTMGANNLTLNNSGLATLNGSITGTGTLTASGSGSLDAIGSINVGSFIDDETATTLGGLVQTTGGQAYGAVTLDSGTTLVGTTIKLGAVSGNDNDLTLDNSSTATLNGAVNNVDVLTASGTGSLAVNNTIAATAVSDKEPTTFSSTAALAGGSTVSTTAGQTYSEPVTLTQNTVLSDSGTGITFGSSATITGTSSSLDLEATGTTTLDAAVRAQSLAVDKTDPAGTIDLNGGVVTTSVGQTYGAPVTLSAATTLSDTGASAITFASTVSGAETLDVESAGATTFGGAVNIQSLTVDQTDTAGTIALNGGAVTTSAGQVYGGAVTLGAPTGLTGTTLSLQGVNMGANNLTLDNSASATLNGAFNGTGTLNASVSTGSLTVNNNITAGSVSDSESTTLNGVTITTTGGDQNYYGAVTLGSGTTTLASDTVELQTVGGSGSLALANTGAATLSASVALTGGLTANGTGKLTVDNTISTATVADSEPTTFNSTATLAGGNTVLTTGDQSYTGPVTLNQNTTLDSGSALELAGVSGTGSLTLANTGAATLNGAISLSGMGALSAAGGGLAVDNTISAASFTDSEPTTFDAAATFSGGTTVATTSGQTYTGAVTLQQNTLLSDTGSGITFGPSATITGAGSALDLESTAATTLGAAVNVKSLTVDQKDTGGTIDLNSGTVTTSLGQSYGGPVTLSAATVLSDTGSSPISFASTVGGANSLDVETAGTTTFGGSVNIQALKADVLDTTGLIDLNGGTITTSGAQAYGGAIALGKNTTLLSTGSGAITLGSTVNGVDSLDIESAGATTVNGAIGNTTPLSSVTIDGTDTTGTAALNGGGVTTTDSQIYGAPIALGAATTLASTDSKNISFNSTVDGAQTLDVETFGTTTFNGAVGSQTALTGVTVDGIDSTGSIALNAGSVTTTGSQTWGGAITLGAGTVLSSSAGGDISLGSTVNGAQTLDVETVGTTTIRNPIGGSTPLVSLTVDKTDTTGAIDLNAGTVTTTGNQEYDGAVTLSGNSTLASSSGGNISFGSTVDGTESLDVETTGTASFNGAIGGKTALTSFTVDGTESGSIDLNAGTVTTTGSQLYASAVVLGTGTSISSKDGQNITFDSTLDGAQSLEIETDGLTKFAGNVGSKTALASLTLDKIDKSGTIDVNGSSVTSTGNQVYDGTVSLSDTALLAATGPGSSLTLQTVDGNGFDLTLLAPTANLLGPAIDVPIEDVIQGASGDNSFFAATVALDAEGGGIRAAFDLVRKTVQTRVVVKVTQPPVKPGNPESYLLQSSQVYNELRMSPSIR